MGMVPKGIGLSLSMRIKLLLATLLLAAVAVTPVFGWGPDGHRIIGDIATKYLTEKTKAAVKELLGEQSLADASNWADEIRKDSSFDWAKPLHYINVPHGVAKVDESRDCKNDQCVTAAIKKYEAVLRDKDATHDAKVQALKFLAHFVGDVHQPLHVSFEDDRGGNDVKVTWLGQSGWNLHRVWDTGLIEHRMATQPSGREAFTSAIENGIKEAKLQQWRKVKEPVAWADESLAITNRLYAEGPKDRNLSEAYYTHNIGIVEQRLAAAGVRLAAMLNSIFDEQPKAKPAVSEPVAPAGTKPG